MYNADSTVVGSRSSFDAVDEKRRLAMRGRNSQAEGRAQDSGPVVFDPENDEGQLPPYHHEATSSFITEKH